jgi:hypothetical protein
MIVSSLFRGGFSPVRRKALVMDAKIRIWCSQRDLPLLQSHPDFHVRRLHLVRSPGRKTRIEGQNGTDRIIRGETIKLSTPNQFEAVHAVNPASPPKPRRRVNPVKSLVFQEAQLAMAARRLSFTAANQPESFVPTSWPSCSSWLTLCFVLLLLMIISGSAQIQQAWVDHYNSGITNGTNQTVKMVLDSGGNIYVTGFSQSTNGHLGYTTIKYAPNGIQQWAARYDPTNDTSTTPTALALDNSNNVLVTGNGLTIKYDPNGNQLWTAPYAGAALSVDTNGNAVVTGINTSFGTVKLNANGSNLWSVTYPSSYGPSLGQQVVSASGHRLLSRHQLRLNDIVTIKYDPNGNQIWLQRYTGRATAMPRAMPSPSITTATSMSPATTPRRRAGRRS